jgi:hypothetical protein
VLLFLPPPWRLRGAGARRSSNSPSTPAPTCPLAERIASMDREAIASALGRAGLASSRARPHHAHRRRRSPRRRHAPLDRGQAFGTRRDRDLPGKHLRLSLRLARVGGAPRDRAPRAQRAGGRAAAAALVSRRGRRVGGVGLGGHQRDAAARRGLARAGDRRPLAAVPFGVAARHVHRVPARGGARR